MVREATATETQPAGAAVEKRPRKLTINDAIDRFEETTRAIEGLRELRAEAEKVLLDHAQRTGRRTFKQRIAVVQTGGATVLDQAKVRDFLGDDLYQFQKRSKLGLALKLLK